MFTYNIIQIILITLMKNVRNVDSSFHRSIYFMLIQKKSFVNRHAVKVRIILANILYKITRNELDNLNILYLKYNRFLVLASENSVKISLSDYRMAITKMAYFVLVFRPSTKIIIDYVNFVFSVIGSRLCAFMN